ncbi:MAG TPA: RNA polymerase sigma factor region1.1 domain-containing protein, partial [Solirubrobacteraceae bacterium]|nr:RNA polymerase sigma factor region1.1 domain-containing protein [Solirubrobacteraceae bacterium]
MSHKLEGLSTTADTAVVEIEELQGIINEGQEKGFLAADVLIAAVEEAELSPQQTQDLFSYLEEHGIDLSGSGEAAPELHGEGRERITGGNHDHALPSGDAEHPLASAPHDEVGERDEQIQGLHVRLEELKRPDIDLTVEPSLDSLR